MARIVEVIWWWAVATGIWLLTLSSVPVSELAVAAASALPCAVAATVGRRLAAERWRGRVQWAAWLIRLPAAVVIDAVRVFALVIRSAGQRGERGQLRTVQLPADEPEVVAATRRALGGTLLSVAPSTFLVDSRDDEHQIVVHALVDSGPDWAQIDPASH